MIRGSIAESFQRQLQAEIDAAGPPEGFYETFKFTKTGQNLCHPITVSLIANARAKLEGVKYVGIDVRLNRGGGTRIKTKGILPYRNWAREHSEGADYVVATSLPNRSAPSWKLRYSRNRKHK